MITEDQLRKIIREEIKAAFNERDKKRAEIMNALMPRAEPGTGGSGPNEPKSGLWPPVEYWSI